MPRSRPAPKFETLTFRIEPALETAFAILCNSDEDAVMRELEADLAEFAKEWH